MLDPSNIGPPHPPMLDPLTLQCWLPPPLQRWTPSPSNVGSPQPPMLDPLTLQCWVPPPLQRWTLSPSNVGSPHPPILDPLTFQCCPHPSNIGPPPPLQHWTPTPPHVALPYPHHQIRNLIRWPIIYLIVLSCCVKCTESAVVGGGLTFEDGRDNMGG